LILNEQVSFAPFISLTAYNDFGKNKESRLTLNTGNTPTFIDVTSASESLYGELSLGANFVRLTPEIGGVERVLKGNIRGDVQFGKERLSGAVNLQMLLQF
jgi:hypothetical protein